MSVTTVLVPVLQSEAEALLAGQGAGDLLSRAARLRPRIARVDGIREDMHQLLFPRWEATQQSSRPPLSGLLGFFRKPPLPSMPAGYDPFVHLFGRSLPVVAPTGKDVVQRLLHLLTEADGAFTADLASDLRTLHPQAAEVWLQSVEVSPPDDLAAAIDRQVSLVAEAMRASPAHVVEAYDGVVRLSAWSWPLWRLDGEMLPGLVRTLGITTELSTSAALFDELQEERPELAHQLSKLPRQLAGFAGAGAYWSSTDVKMVAGALRLQRSQLLRNAAQNSDDPAAGLRHLRLLEEAVFFCEAEGLGLAEAAGVEWHDRPK